MERIEIQPANVAQVHRTSVGKNILIDDDVQGIARDLATIDPSLKLEFDPHEELYIVYQARLLGDGSVEDTLVTTWSVERNGPLDKRLSKRVAQIASEGYDYAAELDRIDREAQAAEDHAFTERFGPMAERLADALLKDLGEDKGRIFVPGRGG